MHLNAAHKMILLAIVAAMFVAGGAYMLYQGRPQNTVPQQVDTFPYMSDAYGITFDYPSTYTLTQSDVKDYENPKNNHHAITIIETKSLEATPVNGEGPTSITVNIYPNSANEGVLSWVKNMSQSNFNLSADKKTYDAQVGGTGAVAYTWDGLYLGNSFALSHRGYIFVLSSTYITPEDSILGVFTEVLKSVQLR